jgi:hypothetical protein
MINSRVMILLLLLVSGRLFGQQSSIVDWYASADSMTQFPPVDQKLAMVERKVGKFYVTFVGINGRPEVLLAAVTAEPIQDVKSISLVVDFDKLKPVMGKVTTWAYVFDRNRDGKIDYVALLTAAAAYEGDDFPDDYPVGKKILNTEQQEYFISHAKLMFDHWADDNYDGKFDAAVVNDCDSLRDMVARQIVVRSTSFNYSFDDVWTFRSNIRGAHMEYPSSAKRVAYRSIGGGPGTLTKASFQEKDTILDLMNRAAKDLKLTEENFYHPEDKE